MRIEKTKYYFNGYSDYVTEKIEEKKYDNFTIGIEVTPYTYETSESGVLSAYEKNKNQGIIISVKKRGILTVKFGTGSETVEICSLKRHLDYQKRNLVTVSFWGEAGWCDLYVNGNLSNRKQFRRHSSVRMPDGNYYMGRYIDGESYVEETRHGYYHGTLKFLTWENRYVPFAEVLKFHKNDSQEKVEKIDLYDVEETLTDIYRPTYHLMPPKKWMNEPHAPFYYKGRYHIFYQANPHAPVWDNLCWGHLVSENMVHWEYVGIALNPDDDKEGLDCDIDGCWSGSACMDEMGEPILFYTAGDNRELPNQSIAVASPKDLNDVRLSDWEKQGVVLRQNMGQGFLGEFRDPFVWRKKDTYYMLVGSGDEMNEGGNALIYTSSNLQDFQYHGFLMDYEYKINQECGHVWELPVLLPLHNEKQEYVCDIFLFCACQIENDIVETYYFLGKFDDTTYRFHKYHEKAMLLDLGNGTFTGPSGFVTPDQRSVLFTIAQGKRGPVEYDMGWAHNGGMPVELSIYQKELHINPIREAARYFSEKIFHLSSREEGQQDRKLSDIELLEHRMRITTEGKYLQLLIDFGKDTYEVCYERKTGMLTVHTKSDNRMISKYRGKEDQVVLDADVIQMDCYFDHSMIEIYLNCKKSISLRNYLYTKGYQADMETDGAYVIDIWKHQ